MLKRSVAIREWLQEATDCMVEKKGWDFDRALDAAAMLVAYELGKIRGRAEAIKELKSRETRR